MQHNPQGDRAHIKIHVELLNVACARRSYGEGAFELQTDVTGWRGRT
jgi:hypothetical protein